MTDTRRCGQCSLRGPVRVDDPPEDNVPVLAICQDGQYRTMKYSADDGRWYGGDGWEMYGDEAPLYWWELPEVAHD